MSCLSNLRSLVEFGGSSQQRAMWAKMKSAQQAGLTAQNAKMLMQQRSGLAAMSATQRARQAPAQSIRQRGGQPVVPTTFQPNPRQRLGALQLAAKKLGSVDPEQAEHASLMLNLHKLARAGDSHASMLMQKSSVGRGLAAAHKDAVQAQVKQLAHSTGVGKPDVRAAMDYAHHAAATHELYHTIRERLRKGGEAIAAAREGYAKGREHGEELARLAVPISGEGGSSHSGY